MRKTGEKQSFGFSVFQNVALSPPLPSFLLCPCLNKEICSTTGHRTHPNQLTELRATEPNRPNRSQDTANENHGDDRKDEPRLADFAPPCTTSDLLLHVTRALPKHSIRIILAAAPYYDPSCRPRSFSPELAQISTMPTIDPPHCKKGDVKSPGPTLMQPHELDHPPTVYLIRTLQKQALDVNSVATASQSKAFERKNRYEFRKTSVLQLRAPRGDSKDPSVVCLRRLCHLSTRDPCRALLSPVHLLPLLPHLARDLAHAMHHVHVATVLGHD